MANLAANGTAGAVCKYCSINYLRTVSAQALGTQDGERHSRGVAAVAGDMHGLAVIAIRRLSRRFGTRLLIPVRHADHLAFAMEVPPAASALPLITVAKQRYGIPVP
jgi:hypothetical protein